MTFRKPSTAPPDIEFGALQLAHARDPHQDLSISSARSDALLDWGKREAAHLLSLHHPISRLYDPEVRVIAREVAQSLGILKEKAQIQKLAIAVWEMLEDPESPDRLQALYEYLMRKLLQPEVDNGPPSSYSSPTSQCCLLQSTSE